MSSLEKEILIKNAMLATKATYQPPPFGDMHLCFQGASSSSFANRSFSSVDINEVYPNIFIGDEATAKNKQYLVAIGITHVLNAAEGHLFGFVNTTAQFYNGTGIIYKGIHLTDLSMSDSSKYFKETANFIDNALNDGGKVLVHCVMGISRSATMVLSFLMQKRGMPAVQAMIQVRQKRNVHPNDGFIHQLAVLDNKLMRKRRNVSPEQNSRLQNAFHGRQV